jgi:hypothetical protein
MLERLSEWSKRVHFPRVATAHLGFGTEYWDPDPTHYEGWEQLRDRLAALGRTSTRRGLAYDLASHLLDDVIVAAGGVERAITKLQEALAGLKDYVREHSIKPKDGIPLVGLGHEAATEAWYAFSEVLSWSRTVVERVERQAGDRKKFPKQGLIPALRPKRLRKRCENLFSKLRSGPVGQARPLANFMLHSALVRHPFSGVEVDSAGAIALPIPDAPIHPVSHWYLLTWNQGRDGVTFAEELWQAIQTFIDNLLDAFEKAVPKRLRKDP